LARPPIQPKIEDKAILGSDEGPVETRAHRAAIVAARRGQNEESLLATCAYIDLNPVAAGIAEVPETSKHTSIKERFDHVFERMGTTADTWQARLEKLREGRLLGRFLAASRQRLREVAERLGLRRAVNLGSCLVT